MEPVAPLAALGRSVAAWARDMHQESYLAAGTAQKYAANVGRFATLAEARGFSDWSQVDRSTVLAYLSAGDPEPSTRRNRLLSVRAFYKWLGTPDPSAGIRSARRSETLPKSLPMDAVEAMLNACDDGTWFGVRDRALLEVAISTGARSSELADLTLADLEISRGTLRLNGRKSRKERLAYLTEPARLALQAWLDARSGLVPSSEPHLFVSQALTRFSAMGMWKVFTKRARLAGLEQRVHPHLFRHSFATHLVRNGADVRSVQTMMGHRSITSTQVYLAANDEWTKQVHERCHPRSKPTEGQASANDEDVRGVGMLRATRKP